MLPYALRQFLWMLQSAVELVLAMSTGIMWVLQTIRLFIFGGTVWVFFLPHWWWYLTSANIIRRVAYRSSQTTKRRNFCHLLEAEGVDLDTLLDEQQQQQQQLSSGYMADGGGVASFLRAPSPSAAVSVALSSAAAAAAPSSSLRRRVLSSGSDSAMAQLHRRVARRFVARRRAPRTSRDIAGELDRLLVTTALNVNPADGSALRSLPRARQPVASNAAAVYSNAHGVVRKRAAPPREHQQQQQQYVSALPPAISLPPSLTRASPVKSSGVVVSHHQQAVSFDSEGKGSSSCGNNPATHHGNNNNNNNSTSAAGLSPEGLSFSFTGKARHYEGLPQPDPDMMQRAEVQHVLSKLPSVHHCDNASQDASSTSAAACGAVDQEAAAAAGVENINNSPEDYDVAANKASSTRAAAAAAAAAGNNAAGARRACWADFDEEDDEDKLNLHNRATVDIILPVPLDSLMKTMESGTAASKSMRYRRKKFPVVIDVSGGAWIIGSHLWGTMLARVLAARGYVVFCPDYRNFPQTTMEGMTLDVSDAIAWVLNNAERYNGDLDDVTLMGQSAGAHLTMMSLLSQAHLCAYESTGRKQGLPPPSSVAYNVARYNPRQSIHRYVGLSGIYNIEGLVSHFHQRGLNRPVFQKIAGGEDQLPRYSVHAYFDARRGGETGEVLPDCFFDYMPRQMFFLHGDADMSAPVTESATLVGVLRQAQKEFTLRRLTRNEENRRHAARSRGLLPGALATPLMPGGAGGEDVGYDSGSSSSNNNNSNSQQTRRAAHATARKALALSPIVPPSSSDLPLTAIDVEFILIPNATHTDAIVEECIVGGRSCAADFICDYESGMDPSCSPVAMAPPRGDAAAAASAATRRNKKRSALEVSPDGILPLAVPPEDRPRALRLFGFFCPF